MLIFQPFNMKIPHQFKEFQYMSSRNEPIKTIQVLPSFNQFVVRTTQASQADKHNLDIQVARFFMLQILLSVQLNMKSLSNW